MMTIDEFKSEWYRNWHEIDPDKSNYISSRQCCMLLDLIRLIAARILRQSNDSPENHRLSIIILQGPEYQFITGSRFTRWLKKKLCKSKPSEILRIVLDDEYYTDILMDAVISLTDVERIDIIFNPMIQRLIKKSKETNNDDDT